MVENALARQIGFDYVPAVNSGILRLSQDVEQIDIYIARWRV